MVAGFGPGGWYVDWESGVWSCVLWYWRLVAPISSLGTASRERRRDPRIESFGFVRRGKGGTEMSVIGHLGF